MSHRREALRQAARWTAVDIKQDQVSQDQAPSREGEVWAEWCLSVACAVVTFNF